MTAGYWSILRKKLEKKYREPDKEMANGLQKQIGESLVVAELGKQGCIATSFAGNVPYFDIVAVNPQNCKLKRIQVKSLKKDEWHGTLPEIFFEIENLANGKQNLKKDKEFPGDIIFVFVEIEREPRYFICKSEIVKKIVREDYFTERNFTIRKRRPNNPISHHHALKRMGIKFKKYENNWKLICGKTKD